MTPFLMLRAPSRIDLTFERDHSLVVAQLDRGGWLVEGSMKTLAGIPNQAEFRPARSGSGVVLTTADGRRWLLPRNGDRRRRYAWTDDVWTSPDGRYALIGPTDRSTTTLYLKDRTTGATQALANHVDTFATSPDGSVVVAVVQPIRESGNGTAIAFDLPSGRRRFEFGPFVNPVVDAVADKGRWFAIMSHLSRPLTGDNLVDAKGQEAPLPEPEGRAPKLIDDFSPDGRHAILQFRRRDPSNDGSWLASDLVEYDLVTRTTRTIGVGEEPIYSPDGSAIVYRTGIEAGDLTRYDRRARRRTLLIPGLKRWIRYGVRSAGFVRRSLYTSEFSHGRARLLDSSPWPMGFPSPRLRRRSRSASRTGRFIARGESVGRSWLR